MKKKAKCTGIKFAISYDRTWRKKLSRIKAEFIFSRENFCEVMKSVGIQAYLRDAHMVE